MLRKGSFSEGSDDVKARSPRGKKSPSDDEMMTFSPKLDSTLEEKSPTSTKVKVRTRKLKKQLTDPLSQLGGKSEPSSYSTESSLKESSPGKMSESKFLGQATKKLADSIQLSRSPRSDRSMSVDSGSATDMSLEGSPLRSLDELGDSTVGRRLATIHEPSDYNIASTSKKTVEESERKKEKLKGASSIVSTSMDVDEPRALRKLTQRRKSKIEKRIFSPSRRARSKSLDSSLTTFAGEKAKPLEHAADQPGFSGGSFKPSSGNSPERENPTTSKAGSSKERRGSAARALWKMAITSVKQSKKTSMPKKLPRVTQLTRSEKEHWGIPFTARGLSWKRLEIIFDINYGETIMKGLVPRIQFYGVENDRRCLYRIEFRVASKMIVCGSVSQYDIMNNEIVEMCPNNPSRGEGRAKRFYKDRTTRFEVGFTTEGSVQFVACGFKPQGIVRERPLVGSKNQVELDMFSFENVILKDLILGW